MAYHHYRVALYLNNVGVELLRKKCLQQAVETFRDAISIMKHLIPGKLQREELLSHFNVSPAKKTMQGILQDAAQRLANPSPSSALLAHRMAFKVFSDEENLTMVLANLYLVPSKDSFTASILSRGINCHLVRVESLETNDTMQKDGSLQCAMILFNCGMAFRCLSLLRPSAPLANSLREGAHYFFDLSYSLLSSEEIFENTNNRTPVIYGTHVSCVVFMTAMTLVQLVEVSTKNEHFAHFLSRLEALIPVFGALTTIEQQCPKKAARAA